SPAAFGADLYHRLQARRRCTRSCPQMTNPSASPEARYAHLTQTFLKRPGVTCGEGSGFGSGALKIGGKIFAMLSSRTEFVVKLPAHFEPEPGPRLLPRREPGGDGRTDGGIAAGQRQNGPGAEWLDGLAHGRVCGETALNARRSDAERLATDVVKLTLLSWS